MENEITIPLYQLIILCVYIVLHTITLIIGLVKAYKAGRSQEDPNNSKPLFMKIADIAVPVAFILGPFALILWFVAQLLVPEKHKIWLHSS